MAKFFKTIAIGLATMSGALVGGVILLWLVATFPKVFFVLIILAMAYFFGSQLYDINERDDRQ